MSSLSRRTATAGLLTLALLGVPTAALAAGPDAVRPAQTERGQERAAAAQDAAPGRSDSAAGRTTTAAASSTSPSPAAAAADRPSAGSAGGAAAGRSAVAPGQARAQSARPEQARPEPARPARPEQARPKSAGKNPHAGKPAEQRNGAKGSNTGPAAGKGKSPQTGKPALAQGKAADKDKGKPAGAARTADPRGNNGTFKVDGPVLDTSHGNEPHVSCAFRLNFFGYDAGQLADISFTAVAPTRGATTRVSGLQLISSNPAKGGLYGGSYPATGTWSAADLGLDPTQRQHVKVSVESVNADGSEVPGGAKHKVFWLEPCGSVAATQVEPVTAPAAVPPAVVAPVVGPQPISAAPVAQAATAPGSAVLSGSVSAQAAAPATVVAAPASLVQPFVLPPVSAVAAAPPASLPFTGSFELLVLLLTGLVTLLGGSALLVAVRRTS